MSVSLFETDGSATIALQRLSCNPVRAHCQVEATAAVDGTQRPGRESLPNQALTRPKVARYNPPQTEDSTMRLYTYELHGDSHIGAESDGRLVDLQAALTALSRVRGVADPAETFANMLSLLRAGESGLNAARRALRFASEASPAEVSVEFSAVRLLAPIPRPGKILCSGINYLSHKEENPNAVLPDSPFFFSKLPSVVIGPGSPIVHPKGQPSR